MLYFNVKNNPDVIFHKTKRPKRTFFLRPRSPPLPALGDMKNGCATLIPPSFFSLYFYLFIDTGGREGERNVLSVRGERFFWGEEKSERSVLQFIHPTKNIAEKNTVFSKYSYFKENKMLFFGGKCKNASFGEFRSLRWK